MTWPTVELRDVAEVVMGQSPPGETYNENGEGLPFFQGKADFGEQFPAVRKWCRAPKKIAEPGDILLSVRAPVGPTNVARERSCIGRGLAAIRGNPERVDQSYLRLCLKHREQALAVQGQGSTFLAISRADIEALDLPLPSLVEQRRIVRVLDQVDHLRRLRAEADAKTARILPALFLKMFGDPITNPNGWPVKRFDEICESRLGKMLDAKQQTGSHSRPYLRNANVYWDRLALDDLLQMDFDEKDRNEFRLQPGDVLICEGGEVGRAAIWNEELAECYYQKALHRARPLPYASVPEYIVYVLWELARRGALREAASGATFSHLTGVKLKALRIPVPPLDLQQRFGQRVRLFKQNDASSASVAGLDRLFKTVRHRALSGRLTDDGEGTGRQETLSDLPKPTAHPAESRV